MSVLSVKLRTALLLTAKWLSSDTGVRRILTLAALGSIAIPTILLSDQRAIFQTWRPDLGPDAILPSGPHNVAFGFPGLPGFFGPRPARGPFIPVAYYARPHAPGNYAAPPPFIGFAVPNPPLPPTAPAFVLPPPIAAPDTPFFAPPPFSQPEALNNGPFVIPDQSGSSTGPSGSPPNGTTGAVPEPGIWLMLLSGIGAIGAILRRLTRARFQLAQADVIAGDDDGAELGQHILPEQ